MEQPDEDAIRWRREEGAQRRRTKDHEDDPDPDWSLAEIARDADDLAREFYDWWNANRLDSDTLDSAFAAWAQERWATPLNRTASGIVKARVRSFQRKHVVAPTIIVPPRGQDEPAEIYIHRIAVENKLIAPDAPPAVKPMPPVSRMLSPLPPIPEDYRAPYKDAPDPDDETPDEADSAEPTCEACGGELGPLDTRFCSDACASKIGGDE